MRNLQAAKRKRTDVVDVTAPKAVPAKKSRSKSASSVAVPAKVVQMQRWQRKLQVLTRREIVGRLVSACSHYSNVATTVDNKYNSKVKE